MSVVERLRVLSADGGWFSCVIEDVFFVEQLAIMDLILMSLKFVLFKCAVRAVFENCKL